MGIFSDAVSERRGYVPPEACECSMWLQQMLAESEMIDPGVDDPWGDF